MIGSISISDINQALPCALRELMVHGRRITAASVANQRPTVEYPGVFITEYTDPTHNVLFDERRDANPYFHYLESMWILAGREDVRFLAHVLPKMGDYSDDGKTFHGAYGYRLREHFEMDQIVYALEILNAEPTTRQVVLSIWDPQTDLGQKTKDMPCNDMIMLKIRDDKLNITVNNRSNDAVLGCYGANAVQFSMLQMYMAAMLDVGVGTYTQVSDSFHVYEDNPYWQQFLQRPPELVAHDMEDDCIHYKRLGSTNLFEAGIEHVDNELDFFFADAERCIADKTCDSVMEASQYRCNAVHDAACIWNALHYGRNREYSKSFDEIDKMHASDWQLGCLRWMERRHTNFMRSNRAVSSR